VFLIELVTRHASIGDFWCWTVWSGSAPTSCLAAIRSGRATI